jgi:hypothetical protein
MEHFALTVFINNVKHRTRVWKAVSGWTLYFCLTLGISSWLAPQAKAGFIEQYPLGVFTLTNTLDTDGFATPSGSSIVLTGGNSGTGETGTTDLVTKATKAGLIQFDFSYSSLDTPTFDYAGYLLNGAFVQLADTNGESGLAQFNVSLGDTFGFRVGTDNQGEPGILTVSSAAPEPGTRLVLVMGIAGILSRRLWLCFRRSGMEGGA